MHPTDTPLRSRLQRNLLGLAAACALAPAAAQAQAPAASYPQKPVRMIVPFTPGGSSDVLARAIGLELSKVWGQPVVVDNIPGAAGSIGAERAAKAPADGHTLLMGHIGTLAVNPALYPKLGYDPVRSFAPVAWVARVPNVLVVNPSRLPAQDLKGFIDQTRAKPGQFNYGSGGNGSAAHTTMEYLKLQTRTSLVHIPYRGTGPAVNDLVAGQLDALFTGAPALLPHIKSGKIRALAVSSPRRMALLPDVPTVAETGLAGTKGFEADQWYGVVAPAGTPPDVIRQLNEQINRALSAPEVKARLAAEGAEATPTTPQAFAELIGQEIKRWAPVVKDAGIRVD